MHIVIVLQYLGLALLIRLPVSRIKSTTQSVCLCFSLLVLLVNTVLGIYWLNCIRLDDAIELPHEYLVWSAALLFIPVSIVLFLIIVVVKIVCYYLVDANQKKRRKRFQSFDDEEQEDSADVDAVVGVYLRAMERVYYRLYDDETEKHYSPRGKYMSQQKQCRMCLVYFQ